MVDADLDYAKVTGRLSLTVGDTADPGDYPDIIWCDSGTVELEPLITYTKVAGGTPHAFTAGNAVIVCEISDADYVDPTGGDRDGAGYLTYNGKPFVYVVDLTSEKVNPRVGENLATHRVKFVDVQADGTPVDFETVSVRLTMDGPDGDGVNDLTDVSPVASGSALPIYRGETGASVESASITGGGELELELTDGTTVNAGELPVGPGGSDPGVAGYLATEGSDSRDAARDLVAGDIAAGTGPIAVELTASFVVFRDQNGDPLPPGSVTTIFVNTVTGDIDDIVFEEA